MNKIDKPWGYELIWAKTDRYAGKILHIENGYCLSLQYHEVKDETIMVKSGILTLELGQGELKTTQKLFPWESVHIPAGTIHRMIADTDLLYIEASTTQLDDVVRLSDDYGRSGAEV